MIEIMYLKTKEAHIFRVDKGKETKIIPFVGGSLKEVLPRALELINKEINEL